MPDALAAFGGGYACPNVPGPRPGTGAVIGGASGTGLTDIRLPVDGSAFITPPGAHEPSLRGDNTCLPGAITAAAF